MTWSVEMGRASANGMAPAFTVFPPFVRSDRAMRADLERMKAMEVELQRVSGLSEPMWRLVATERAAGLTPSQILRKLALKIRQAEACLKALKASKKT